MQRARYSLPPETARACIPLHNIAALPANIAACKRLLRPSTTDRTRTKPPAFARLRLQNPHNRPNASACQMHLHTDCRQPPPARLPCTTTQRQHPPACTPAHVVAVFGRALCSPIRSSMRPWLGRITAASRVAQGSRLSAGFVRSATVNLSARCFAALHLALQCLHSLSATRSVKKIALILSMIKK